MKEYVIRSIGTARGPVASTLFAETFLGDLARRDAWLFQVVDRAPAGPKKVIEIPESVVRFFEAAVLHERAVQPWLSNLQGELRRKYARLLAMQLPRAGALEPRSEGHLQSLAQDFHGALGLVEGLLSNERGYDARRAVALLDQVRMRMPSDAGKQHQARYFELRAHLRQGQGDKSGSLQDLETAFALWPVKENGAIAPLRDQYVANGNQAALHALQARLRR